MMSLINWLKKDVESLSWVIAGECALLLSSFIIADLCLKPLFSYYSESTYMGEFATHSIVGIVIGYILCQLLIPQLKAGLRKRYIIVIKFLCLPFAVLFLAAVKSQPFYRETIHDLPRGAKK